MRLYHIFRVNLPHSPSDCRRRNPTDLRGRFDRQFPASDSRQCHRDLSGVTYSGPSKLHAALHCGVNALALSFPDVCSFRFGNERKKIQNEICDKFSNQSVCLVCRIKKRHIENANIHAFDFDEDSPLLQNVLIIPAETVEGLDNKHIPGFKLPDKPFPSRSIEVLAACHVDENLIVCNARFM